MTILMILLAVIGGALLSIQAAINGQLGAKVGVFRSAFFDFLGRCSNYSSPYFLL